MNAWTRIAAPLIAALLIAPAAHAGTADPPLALTGVFGGQFRPPVVDGARLYVPSGRIVTTWNHADPSAPQALATTAPASGLIYALTRHGDYLYAGWQSGDDNAGVAVYSLADPDHPVLVNDVVDYTFSSLRVLRSLVAANGHLYLFDAENGVFYGTLEDPEHPVFTRAFRTPTLYEYTFADGPWIYAYANTVMGLTALTVFDVSDPTNPTMVSGSSQFLNVDLFAVHPRPPVAAGFGLQLTVFDVSTPSNVVQRGQIETPPATNGVVIGDHAYSVGFDGLDAWSIADLDNPAFAGHFDIPTLGTEATASIGDHALLLTSTDRLVRIDGSTPSQPTPASIAYLPGGSAARDVAFRDGHAIVLQEGYGFSVADPQTLAPRARFDADLPEQLNMRDFEQFAVDGDRAYLAAWGYGLIVAGIGDPLAPVELGRLEWPFASAVAAQGDYVYLGKTTGGSAMYVVEVSNPAAPAFRGGFTNVNDLQRLQVRGNRVYIADALLGGLRILDVANPDAPTQIGFYDQDCESLGNTASDVALSADGQTAYVACPNGLHIVDVANPASPSRIGAYATDGWSFRATVEVRGDRAWYGDSAGVHEIDIANPAAPALLALTPLGYHAPNRLRAAPDGRLFAFASQVGVHVFAPPASDVIFAHGFEDAPAGPEVTDYDDLTEGFLGASFQHRGVSYHDVNGVGGVFPNGDTFTPDDVGSDFIVENATLFYGEFPDFGSAPNALTFGTAYIPGDNLSLGAFVKARMDLPHPAVAASFDMAYYENGPWGGIVFHLDAFRNGVLVASEQLTIAGSNPDDRDNIAVSSLSVAGAEFDSLYLYATYGSEFSAPRLMIDDLTITYAAP